MKQKLIGLLLVGVLASPKLFADTYNINSYRFFSAGTTADKNKIASQYLGWEGQKTSSAGVYLQAGYSFDNQWFVEAKGRYLKNVRMVFLQALAIFFQQIKVIVFMY